MKSYIKKPLQKQIKQTVLELVWNLKIRCITGEGKVYLGQIRLGLDKVWLVLGSRAG